MCRKFENTIMEEFFYYFKTMFDTHTHTKEKYTCSN